MLIRKKRRLLFAVKNKIKNHLKEFNEFSNSQNYKFILVSLIMFAIYFSLVFPYSNTGERLPYTDAFIAILSIDLQIFITLSIIALTTVFTVARFDKNLMYIIRLKDKNRYLNNLLINTFINVFITICLELILIATFLLVMSIGNFSMNNFPHLIFLIIKFIVISMIFAVGFALLLKLFDMVKGTILIFFINVIVLINGSFLRNIISSIKDINLFLGIYYYDVSFSSLLFGISVITLVSLITIFILYCIKKIILKYKNNII